MKNSEEIPHVHFRETTAAQRKMLFKLVNEEGYTIKRASVKSHVGDSFYYYWLPRFLESGYEGLEHTKSKAPKNPGNKKSEELVKQVLELKKNNPRLGKLSISNQINKEHNWEKVISSSTVGVILGKHNLSHQECKKKIEQRVCHAEQPNQAVNIDFGFVKSEHMAEEAIPAVSGSSGRLKAPSLQTTTAQWPGQVFNDTTLNFSSAMDSYAEKKNQAQSAYSENVDSELNEIAALKKELNRQTEELKIEHRKTRATRKTEDQAHETLRKEHQAAKQDHKKLTRKEKLTNKEYLATKEKEWQAHKINRQKIKEKRQAENELWRANRQKIIEQQSKLPVTKWLAILIIIDNCTRKAISLPLFVSGVHTTAQATALALQMALPLIEYLISDRGVHFKNKYVEQLAKDLGFKHIFVGPHRPQTNGIAERFVRTLKKWLFDKTWTGEQDMQILLEKFKNEYNNRPHQGKELKGLSPIEYEKRLLNK